MRAMVLLVIPALAVTVFARSAQAQAQYGYKPGYKLNQGGRYRPYYGNNGRSPSGRPYASPGRGSSRFPGYSPGRRPYAAPRPTPTPTYRQPSPYLPGGSLYSPFNMGQTGGHAR